MLTLIRKNGKRRSEVGAPSRVDDVSRGMNLGATLAAGFGIWLLAIEVVSGPGVFERVGLTLWELAGLYYVAGLVLGGAIGALERVRHRPLGAVLQFLLIPPLPMVAIPVNMGLSYGRPPLPLPVLVSGLIVFWVLAGWWGFWIWREERRAEPPSASGRVLRLEQRSFQRRPSQG